MAIRITMELDYPTIAEAFEKNSNLSTLISSSKCLEFSTKTEVASVLEFNKIKNQKLAEFLERFEGQDVSAELSKTLDSMAFEYVNDNFYYHPLAERMAKGETRIKLYKD